MFKEFRKNFAKFLSLVAKGGIYGNMVNANGGGVYVDNSLITMEL